MQEEFENQRLRQLYITYHQDVYQFLVCFTGNRQDAEDLTQEVFIQLISAISTFEGRSSLKTWILRVAKYTAFKWYRKKKLLSILPDGFLKSVPSDRGRPETELEDNEERKELLRAIQNLKASYRIIIILRVFKDFSIKEAADILGCSEAKVKVDYHRALKKLHEQYSHSARGGWLIASEKTARD